MSWLHDLFSTRTSRYARSISDPIYHVRIGGVNYGFAMTLKCHERLEKNFKKKCGEIVNDCFSGTPWVKDLVLFFASSLESLEGEDVWDKPQSLRTTIARETVTRASLYRVMDVIATYMKSLFFYSRKDLKRIDRVLKALEKKGAQVLDSVLQN